MVREVLSCYDHNNHSNHNIRCELGFEWYIHSIQSLSWGIFLEVCLCEVASDISLNSSDKVYTMVPEELLAHLFACLETSGFSKIRFLMKDSWRIARFLCRQFHAAQQAWLECLLWPGIVWSYSDLQSWSEILSSGSSQSKWSYIDNV